MICRVRVFEFQESERAYREVRTACSVMAESMSGYWKDNVKMMLIGAFFCLIK